MQETAALDFARYLIEQAGQTLSYDETDEVQNNDFVLVDQEKKTIGIKVIMHLTGMIRSALVYYRKEREDDILVIIGDKLQEPKAKDKLLKLVDKYRSESKLSYA